MTKKKENKEHHVHNHYYPTNVTKIIIYFFLGLMFIIIISNLSNSIIEKITEKQTIYTVCTDACSEKHFSGVQIGVDGETMSGNINPYVVEFDRTACIKNCNDMYQNLRGVE